MRGSARRRPRRCLLAGRRRGQHEGSLSDSMLGDHHALRDPVPDRAVGRRVRARVRPLLGRAPQRRADRGVLDRLRAGAVRPQRPRTAPAGSSARVPLGGYVKMLRRRRCGQRDSRSQPARAEPDSFPAKSVWQRMAIVVGGPVGQLRLRHRRAGDPVRDRRPTVHPGRGRRGAARTAPPAAAGLLPGDRIIAVDGKPIASFEELQSVVRDSPGRPLAVHDRARGPDRWSCTVTPPPARSPTGSASVHGSG